ncbi:MAG: hypothetical protein WKF35_03130 [Ferruginibacter sp.]
MYDKFDPDPTKTVDNCIPELLSLTASVEMKLNAAGVGTLRSEFDPLIISKNQLVIDGYMVEYPLKSGYFYLTGLGRRFLTLGGYQHLFDEQEAAKKLNSEQMQSVIDTNANVKSTNTFSKISNSATLLFTLLITSLQLYQCNQYKVTGQLQVDKERQEQRIDSERIISDKEVANQMNHILLILTDSIKKK